MSARKDTIEDEAFEQAGAEIHDTSLSDEIESSFLEYAYSVIHSRALPDARDGLKPVHRRILYAMREMGLRPDASQVKSARVVGDCFVSGTLVSTPNGLTRIEDLDIGDRVITPSGRDSVVVERYRNPTSEMVNVRFAHGVSIRVTPGQLFRVVADDYTTSWSRADELTGKTVLLSNTSSGEQAHLSASEALWPYVQGLVISEGYQVHRTREADGRVAISMVDPEPLEAAVEWANQAGINVYQSQRQPTNEKWLLQHKVSFSRHNALLEMTKDVARKKQVPESVLIDRNMWPPFLAGFVDGDGSLHPDRRVVSFPTTSPELSSQLYAMLMDMGFPATRLLKEASGRNKMKFDLHTLEVRGINAKALAGLLRPYLRVGQKKSRATEILLTENQNPLFVEALPAKAFFDEFSNAHLGGGWFRDVSGKKFRDGLKDRRGVKIRYGKDGNGRTLETRPLNLRTARELGWLDKLARIGSPLFERLVQLEGYSFAKVDTVEKIPDEETFDIQVSDKDHAFIADGFIVHNCLGKWHPHGDSSVYEAMVRMAQDFSLNTPLVHGHGNFGSPNDGAAAMRYTECKLAPMAMNMVGELGEDTVDFVPNYDGSLDEPSVLPSMFPNLLVNGGSGIAVGMATNMIPHNLGEVVSAARALVKKPDLSLDQLMKHVPGPDLPTGGIVLGADQVRQAYEMGRGTVRLRGRCEVAPLEGSRGRMAITFTELPYQVGSEKVIESIKAEILKKRLVGVSDVKDLSDRKFGTRLVIECKTGVNPQALLGDLYRYTPLEQSFGINNLALVDGQPKTLGLRELLTVWLDFRYESVTRRTEFRLAKAEARKHIVEGLLIALDAIDAVVKTIRASKDTSEAKSALMKKFKLSDIQTSHILEMPLRRLVSLEVVALREELAELLEMIKGLRLILDNRDELRAVVDRELAALAKAFPSPRRSELLDGELKELLAASAAASAPLLVEDEPCVVFVSSTGLLTRTAGKSEETAAARAKRGRVKHDALVARLESSTRGRLVVITSMGRGLKTDVLSIPALPDAGGTVAARGGIAGKELVDLLPGERVITVVPLLEEYPKEALGVALGTKLGVVKICAPDWPLRSDEFEVISLKEGDEVIGGAWVPSGDRELVFVTADAALLHFPVSKVRPQGRSSAGVAGVKLPFGAEVISFNVVNPAGDERGKPVVVTSTGSSVKVAPFDAFPAKGRATGGVRAHKFLKDELELTVAWVGVEPHAANEAGEPVELPSKLGKRDGSGVSADVFDVVGEGFTR